MYLQQKETFKSGFGGLSSLCIIAFFILVGLSGILDVYNKSSPLDFRLQENYNYIPRDISLKNYMIAVGFSNQ